MHAAVVLRLKPGDSVEVVDGKGHLGSGSVTEIKKSRIELSLDHCIHVALSARPKLILACAIPKANNCRFSQQME
jgi:16S rRNA U1498 N3-methylase RsmE